MHYITGEITETNKEYVVIETLNKEGIKVHILSVNRYEKGSIHKFYIYKDLRIENNSIIEKIFGFKDQNHLSFFKFLLQIKGIGIQSARKIMNYSLSSLIQYILKEDEYQLKNIPELEKYLNEILKLSKKPKYKKILLNISLNKDIDSEKKLEIFQILQNLGISEEKIHKFMPEINNLKNKEIGEIVKEIFSKIYNEK